MLTLALLIAAPTLPTIESGMLVNADYPRIREMDREEGSVTVRLLISPEGRAVRCGLLRPSGTKELDGTTCAVFLTRTRFTPAKDADGRATYGEMELPVIWRMVRGSPPKRQELPPLYDFTVAKLPDGVEPVRVAVILSINADGSLGGCSPAAEDVGPNSTPAPPALRSAACGALRSAWTVLPVVDERGAPTSYVRRAQVRFST